MASVHSRMPSELISHWGNLIDDFQFSPQAFYERVEALISARELPQTSWGRIKLRQGKGFRGDRLYLRVVREEHVFDICASPFGKNSMFVSWWLGALERRGCLGTLLQLVPIVGDLLQAKDAPTYYTLDVAMAFQEAIRTSVMDVLDALMEDQGLRKFIGDDRKPMMKDFFK